MATMQVLTVVLLVSAILAAILWLLLRAVMHANEYRQARRIGRSEPK